MKRRHSTEDSEATLPQPLWVELLERIGSPVHEHVSTFIDILDLWIKVLRRMTHLKSWRWNEITQAIIQISLGSLPLIAISTAFAGLVVTNEIAWHMDAALHSTSMVPGFTGQFILRELGVAIPALLLVSKVGAAITAEVGTMKITDQIDALKLLGIDPYNYLVVPRFIAALISGACLTLIAISVTLLSAIGIASFRYNISVMEYVNAFRHFVVLKDVLCAIVKGVVYAGIIPLISCAYGFRCRGGAEGVGTATTNSVVSATVAIIILDFILTYCFSLIL